MMEFIESWVDICASCIILSSHVGFTGGEMTGNKANQSDIFSVESAWVQIHLSMYVSTQCQDWRGFKQTVVLLNQQVTRSVYLLIQLAVHCAFITALRPDFHGPIEILTLAFALESSQSASRSHLATLLLELRCQQQNHRETLDGGKLSFFHFNILYFLFLLPR